MSSLGRVRIGHEAPDFHCDAVTKGLIEEVSLATYINPEHPSWLIIIFIPAAFSFVCPTEVLAFQNCLQEFRERNCDVVFVSVDTKHSLWHWQNVPRQYGGLGQIEISLLSDPSHKISRDYGVLIEDEGVCLRGMFIIDDGGIVQQITLNNLTVGRSVVEALRLLEAFQAVAKHGVLCPVDWRPNTNTADTINTISNMLTESYDERLANLQKEFGDMPVTDLDAKHDNDSEDAETSMEAWTSESKGKGREGSTSTTDTLWISSVHSSSTGDAKRSSTSASSRTSSHSAKSPAYLEREQSPGSQATITLSQMDLFPRSASPESLSPVPQSFLRPEPASAPASTSVTPKSTPALRLTPPVRDSARASTARHRRGHSTSSIPPHRVKPSSRNMYESSDGSHVILEFADPIHVPPVTPHASVTSSPALSRTTSQGKDTGTPSKQSPRSDGASQTRLQMTFDAIKRMGAGLSPRQDSSAKGSAGSGGEAKSSGGSTAVNGGYFDVVIADGEGSR